MSIDTAVEQYAPCVHRILEQFTAVTFPLNTCSEFSHAEDYYKDQMFSTVCGKSVEAYLCFRGFLPEADIVKKTRLKYPYIEEETAVKVLRRLSLDESVVTARTDAARWYGVKKEFSQLNKFDYQHLKKREPEEKFYMKWEYRLARIKDRCERNKTLNAILSRTGLSYALSLFQRYVFGQRKYYEER